eukprot:1161584-Pelagomonas_calceolata.AAC.4
MDNQGDCAHEQTIREAVHTNGQPGKLAWRGGGMSTQHGQYQKGSRGAVHSRARGRKENDAACLGGGESPMQYWSIQWRIVHMADDALQGNSNNWHTHTHTHTHSLSVGTSPAAPAQQQQQDHHGPSHPFHLIQQQQQPSQYMQINPQQQHLQPPSPDTPPSMPVQELQGPSLGAQLRQRPSLLKQRLVCWAVWDCMPQVAAGSAPALKHVGAGRIQQESKEIHVESAGKTDACFLVTPSCRHSMYALRGLQKCLWLCDRAMLLAEAPVPRAVFKA